MYAQIRAGRKELNKNSGLSDWSAGHMGVELTFFVLLNHTTATIAQATVVTRTTMTQDAPTQTVLPPPPPPPPLTSHVVVIVVTVTVVLTVFLMSAVSVAFLLLCIRRGRQKRQRLRTVKREEMNQNCTG